MHTQSAGSTHVSTDQPTVSVLGKRDQPSAGPPDTTTVSTAQTIETTTTVRAARSDVTIDDDPSNTLPIASTLVRKEHDGPPEVTRVQETHIPNQNMQSEAEIQTAEALLELHETLGVDATLANNLPEDNILDDYDNAAIMPVNAPPAPDYSKDYPLPAPTDNLETGDTDDTIEYSDTLNEMEQEEHETMAVEDTSVRTQDQSPPGRFRFRHHGIRRNLGSPKTKTKS